MKVRVEPNTVYALSGDVVAREICGEFVIVPITSEIGESENDIFTVNETGRAIWDKLDGRRSLKDIIGGLSLEFEASAGEIEKDVLGLTGELLKRKMVVKAGKG